MIKVLPFIMIFISFIIATSAYFYSHKLPYINYFDLFSDSIITIIVLFPIILTQFIIASVRVKYFLLSGFICLFISLLSNTMDEIIIISKIYENIFEDLFQLLAYIFISIGIYGWIKFNTTQIQSLNEYNQKLSKLNTKLQKEINRRIETEREASQLGELLPICSRCKKIRDDKGYWQQIESYIETHLDSKFTHGLCRDCSDELYGTQEWYKKLKESDKDESN